MDSGDIYSVGTSKSYLDIVSIVLLLSLPFNHFYYSFTSISQVKVTLKLQLVA